MSKRDRERVIQELKDHLLGGDEEMPTSSVGRIGRTALAALRSARAIRKQQKRAQRGDLDPSSEMEAMVKLVTSIGKLKGIAMKMGQIMSYIDIALPEEFQSALSVLQTHAQPMPFARVSEIVEADLGQLAGELMAQMEERPLAAASIGQVHAARLPDGTEVAVKVRYPEIDRAIANDFGAASFGSRMATLFYPNARVDEFISEARQRFLEECDYELEADRQQRFAQLFAEHRLISVPRVHPRYCSRSVLTTTLVHGQSFEEFLHSDPSQQERDRIGEALFEFYIGTLFCHGLYNCDPHPGNYLFLCDGRVAMLDYGCTRQFEPAFVDKLAGLTLAVHDDDQQSLHRAFVDIGLVSEDRDYDFDTARGLVRGFYGPMLRDEHQPVDLGEIRDMRGIYRAKKELLKLSLPGEFLFLFRIRFGLMSVLARLGARANWYRLERRYVGEG